MWDDNTVGYFRRYTNAKGMSWNRKKCAQIKQAHRVILDDCFGKVSQDFLCEKNGAPDKPYARLHSTSGPRNIRLTKPTVPSAKNVTQIACLLGHWARDFLACDVRSACWQDEHFAPDSGSDVKRSLKTLCESPLSTLFKYRIGSERVSYSRVCDHSQDCLDASDEDFCVYPPCAGTHHFECFNKQVRRTFGGGGITYVCMDTVFGIMGTSVCTRLVLAHITFNASINRSDALWRG